MVLLGLGFPNRVSQTAGKTEIGNAQEGNDANNGHPRAVTLVP